MFLSSVYTVQHTVAPSQPHDKEVMITQFRSIHMKEGVAWWVFIGMHPSKPMDHIICIHIALLCLNSHISELITYISRFRGDSLSSDTVAHLLIRQAKTHGYSALPDLLTNTLLVSHLFWSYPQLAPVHTATDPRKKGGNGNAQGSCIWLH